MVPTYLGDSLAGVKADTLVVLHCLCLVHTAVCLLGSNVWAEAPQWVEVPFLIPCSAAVPGSLQSLVPPTLPSVRPTFWVVLT